MEVIPEPHLGGESVSGSDVRHHLDLTLALLIGVRGTRDKVAAEKAAQAIEKHHDLRAWWEESDQDMNEIEHEELTIQTRRPNTL